MRGHDASSDLSAASKEKGATRDESPPGSDEPLRRDQNFTRTPAYQRRPIASYVPESVSAPVTSLGRPVINSGGSSSSRLSTPRNSSVLSIGENVTCASR